MTSHGVLTLTKTTNPNKPSCRIASSTFCDLFADLNRASQQGRANDIILNLLEINNHRFLTGCRDTSTYCQSLFAVVVGRMSQRSSTASSPAAASDGDANSHQGRTLLHYVLIETWLDRCAKSSFLFNRAG